MGVAGRERELAVIDRVRYATAAGAVDRPHTNALAAPCRGIVAASRGDLAAATAHLDDALVEHGLRPTPLDVARTLLLRGRLERRQRSKAAARSSMGEALAGFERIGARRWADQARAELARVAAKRAPGELSETEARVAHLAATGMTNREVAARLYISPKTVEANLARVHRKLGIRSRAELGAWHSGKPSENRGKHPIPP